MSATYKTRPIFDFIVDHGSKPRITLQYDLKPLQIGFGKVRFAPLQNEVTHGFSLTVWLQNSTEIKAIEDFFDDLQGRLRGFWLPSPHTAMRVSAGVSTTQFDIEDKGLTETWENHPARFLYFEKDGDLQFGEITSVSDNGDGTERVTLDEAVSTAIDDSWEVHLLHYVRLIDDEEQATLDNEGQQTRRIEVVELPSEYAGFELGTQPVWLYYFYMDLGATRREWRFTSYYEDVVSDGETFTAAAMTHGALERTLRGDTELVTIEAEYDAANPLSLFIPFQLPARLFCYCTQVTVPSPDDETSVFNVEVGRVMPSGKRLTAQCESVFDSARKVPGFRIQPLCNYDLYEPNTCKLNVNDFLINATIDSIDGRTVVVSGPGLNGLATDYFTIGWIETGTGNDFEIRSVLKDTSTDTEEHTLILNLPLNNAVATDSIVLIPSCARTFTTCVDKFANGDNFGGHPHKPNRNLTLQGLVVPNESGGKK